MLVLHITNGTDVLHLYTDAFYLILHFKFSTAQLLTILNLDG